MRHDLHARFAALGTSSAALAWACGHADGGTLPRAALMEKVRDIVRVAAVPVSIDIEHGYSDDPGTVAALVHEIAATGAVGIDIEDGAFVPCIKERREIAAIAAIAAGSTLPLNVMAMPGLPPLADLQRAGVHRISAGEGLFQHAFAAGLEAVRGFLTGDTARPLDTAIAYGELNALFGR